MASANVKLRHILFLQASSFHPLCPPGSDPHRALPFGSPWLVSANWAPAPATSNSASAALW
jgi:hypothetical protein